MNKEPKVVGAIILLIFVLAAGYVWQKRAQVNEGEFPPPPFSVPSPPSSAEPSLTPEGLIKTSGGATAVYLGDDKYPLGDISVGSKVGNFTVAEMDQKVYPVATGPARPITSIEFVGDIALSGRIEFNSNREPYFFPDDASMRKLPHLKPVEMFGPRSQLYLLPAEGVDYEELDVFLTPLIGKTVTMTFSSVSIADSTSDGGGGPYTYDEDVYMIETLTVTQPTQ